MRRKAIERLAPKRAAGKGLTATLQEFGKILILNIYQAKDLLVRYCINYETGEHEYWIEQHGWRKGGILNALNEEWRDWEWRYCGKSSEASGIKRQDGGKKIRHNDMVCCPACGKLIQAKTRTDHMEQEYKSCYLLQPVDEDTSVLRILEAKVGWDNGRHYVELGGEIRILLYKVFSNRKLKRTYKIYYEDYLEGWTEGNRKNLRARQGYLYPGEFDKILEGTIYSGASKVLEFLSAQGQELNYNRLIAGAGQMKEYAEKIEYLSKGRFWNLLKDTVERTEYPVYQNTYYGPLNLRADSIEEMFLIRDRQKINRIRDEQGGNDMVRWMQYSDEIGKKISRETVRWMTANRIRPEDIRELEEYMSPQQIMNYIIRQQAEQYPGKKPKEVLEEYKDYINMCEACSKNMKDEMVYRPRELKRRHDEVVVDRQQMQILRELDTNTEAKEKYAEEMRQKFPKAEGILKEIKSRYEYENEEYKILVPDTMIDIVKEGRALHHCAGSSERYFDRIESRETYICFLRRKEAPGIPFYTIEVEPGGTIRQHRSYLDEEPGIEQIREFLKEWQKVIRKRLTEEDKKLAKISKIKREANIEELKAKNNTRVLQGLAEDFLEAEEIQEAV